jgi:hypothetical protein
MNTAHKLLRLEDGPYPERSAITNRHRLNFTTPGNLRMTLNITHQLPESFR